MQTNQTTRERVLQTLHQAQRCTINELADAVEINPISVRHHITKLQLDGLVDSAEERHGVGRPRRVYFLTESGLERFPTRYVQMSLRLLEQLKQKLPAPVVRDLFTEMARDLMSDQTSNSLLENMDIEQRLELVKSLLIKEGFDIEWEQKDGTYHIRETNCPYFQIGQAHPEICLIDQTLISNVLSVPVQKVRCVLQGDNYCTYVVSG
ncbi:MAG: HTH domain-containing protein [Anaerolineales bacterium]